LLPIRFGQQKVTLGNKLATNIEYNMLLGNK
jgi:hypothetical protein